jgi:hypothetical protein
MVGAIGGCHDLLECQIRIEPGGEIVLFPSFSGLPAEVTMSFASLWFIVFVFR